MGGKVKIDGVAYDKRAVLESLAMAAANARNVRIEEKKRLASEDEKERYQQIGSGDRTMGDIVGKLILAYTGNRVRFNRGGPSTNEMANNPERVKRILEALRSTGSAWPVEFAVDVIGSDSKALENKYKMYCTIVESVLEDITKKDITKKDETHPDATGLLVPLAIDELHARNVRNGKFLSGKPVYFEVTKTSWYSSGDPAEDRICTGTEYVKFSITVRYATKLNEDNTPKRYSVATLELDKEDMEYFVSMYLMYLAQGLVREGGYHTEGTDVLSEIARRHIIN